ncbi:MAG TPA: hypothetical protein VJB94_04290 [Candidatus Nanoarchaeia archaeon]|nr:hypothetical protein [Candidatus Nanoarchaeia archaeon]
MNSKKGQAALEYMATYGWVIVAIMASVAAIYYFGVLDFSKFKPESCSLTIGLDCVGFRVATSSADIVVRNGLGYDLTEFNITFESDGGPCDNVLQAASSGLNDGEEEKLSFTCAISSESGEKITSRLKISYTSSGSPHISYGKLEAEVE